MIELYNDNKKIYIKKNSKQLNSTTILKDKVKSVVSIKWKDNKGKNKNKTSNANSKIRINKVINNNTSNLWENRNIP